MTRLDDLAAYNHGVTQSRDAYRADRLVRERICSVCQTRKIPDAGRTCYVCRARRTREKKEGK